MKDMSFEKDIRPYDECGVFGIFNHPQAANLTYLGLYALQHRGQESAGIAASDGRNIARYAGMGKVVDVFNETHLSSLCGNMAIGHNRYSTTGSSYLRNAQPLRAESRLGPIVVAHNGNLVNTPELHREFVNEGRIFQTSVDSEVVIHLMARSKDAEFKDALITALKQIKGAYALLVMNKNALYAVRDPNGFRPLSLAKLGDTYVVASETCAFDIIDAEYIRDIQPGELIEITSEGIKSFFPFEKREESMCVFEYIYFARPDSYIFGQSVHGMRIALGRELAKLHPAKADIVVHIPDSSTAAALGFSLESGIPHEQGMIRNHYIGRTFIEPSQKIRDFGAKIKYNVVRNAVKGKKIVVVDDSIMRGTTMRKIIAMFRNAGATEIHVRISAPPTMFPCYYGIDIPTTKELIAANKPVNEIAEYLGVDSLGYLTVEALLEAVKSSNLKYCTACFDGKYPLKFEDKDNTENLKFGIETSCSGAYY